MYANMTEELLDPKPENQETLRQKRVAHIEEYLASAEADAISKAQATLRSKYDRAWRFDWSHRAWGVAKIDDSSNP